MFSKLLRRSHMYLALFLTPWVLIYALSTMAMNHRALFQSHGAAPVFEKEREQQYDGGFQDATPKQIAQQLLWTLGMDGAHQVNARKDGTIVIQRLDPIHPQRITYTPATRMLLVEKQVFQPHAFLERMHRRRGFQHDYLTEDAWAISVDLFIAAMVFWALSGLWMWWQLKVTRLLGAVCLIGGATVFAFYLVTI